MRVHIINGPNLNLVGRRQTYLYGELPFEEFLEDLRRRYPDVTIDYYQSNIEGELIDKIHEIGFTADGIIINAGGYTHTSVSIADALAGVETPAVEVHITNILGRDEYRNVSFVANACEGSLMGLGLDVYRLALEALLEKKRRKEQK